MMAGHNHFFELGVYFCIGGGNRCICNIFTVNCLAEYQTSRKISQARILDYLDRAEISRPGDQAEGLYFFELVKNFQFVHFRPIR